MAITREQFQRRLSESGLLDEDEAARVVGEVPESTAADGKALAQALVRSGVLTKYQAAAIYQGKTKGLVLGKYVIMSRIGTGGMGQVFKAMHQRMERLVALKVLPSDKMSSGDAVKRFHREVKAAARLNHPNIVTAHDAGEDDGLHFLVMEYVDGSDMSTLIKDHGAFPIDLGVECIRQAAVALAYAHKQGVIHRDIKPANLLLACDAADGKTPVTSPSQAVVKILDMGLARLDKSVEDNTASRGLTQTGQVMGTVDFMAPEQAESQRETDHRSDIYSLGCTLYAVLTADAPYEGDSLIEKLMAHRVRPAPSLIDARRDIPPRLNEIFQKMVAKEPEDRFQTMDELVEAITDLQSQGLPGAEGTAPQGAFFGREAGPLDMTIDRPSTKTDLSRKTIKPVVSEPQQETATDHTKEDVAEKTLIETTPARTPVASSSGTNLSDSIVIPPQAAGEPERTSRPWLVVLLMLLLLSTAGIVAAGWYYANSQTQSNQIVDRNDPVGDPTPPAIDPSDNNPDDGVEDGDPDNTEPEDAPDGGNPPIINPDDTGTPKDPSDDPQNNGTLDPPDNGNPTDPVNPPDDPEPAVVVDRPWRDDPVSPPIPPDLPFEPPMVVEVLPPAEPDPRDDPVSPPTPPDPLARGLGGHWKFTDGGGEVARDASGFGNNGRTFLVVQKDWEPLDVGDGREIPALSLNGLASVTVRDDDSLDATDELTVAMWMKSGGNKKQEMILLDKGPTTGYSLTLDQSGYPRFRMGLDNRGRTSAESFTAPRRLNDGQPHHIAIVFDGRKMQFFLDGKPSFNLPMYGKVRRNALPLRIGGGEKGKGGFYGHVADVRVYQRALSDEEISELADP